MEHTRFVGLDIPQRTDLNRGGGERTLWRGGNISDDGPPLGPAIIGSRRLSYSTLE